MEPIISIIIPCFKSIYVCRTIDSLIDASHFFCIDYEIIVCVHDKDDITLNLLLKYEGQKIKVTYSDKPGVTSNRNAGIKAARGKWLYFLDSDDCVLKTFFSTFYNLRKYDYDMAYVGGERFSVKKSIKDPIFVDNYDLFYSDREIIQFSYCTYFFKKEFLIANRLFVDENITNSEDYLFVALCLSKSPKLLLTSEVVFHYNVSLSSLSKSSTYNDCVASILSFSLLFDIFEVNNMPKSLLRYSQILVSSILDKPIFLPIKEKNNLVVLLKKQNLKKYIKNSVRSTKRFSYLMFGYKITWFFLGIKRKGC